jgi:hypothetical protein
VSESSVRRILKGVTYKEIADPLALKEMRRRGPGKGQKHGGCPLGFKREEGCQRGERNGRATLNEVTVSYIKAHLSENVSQTWLAKTFKTTRNIVRDIARKRNWNYVKPHPNPPPIKFAKKPIRLCGDRLQAKLNEALDRR